MFDVLELTAYAFGFLIYIVLVLHSISAIARLRDYGYSSAILAYAYFIAVVFGIPFVFVSYVLTRF